MGRGVLTRTTPTSIGSRAWLLIRVRAEFDEAPGLELTPAEAVRFWGLDEPTCEWVLDRLTQLRFLNRDANGRYRRSHAA